MTRQAAQQYTELGWVIHPIKPPEPGNKNTGKAPFESAWQKRARPRTADELNKFWAGTGYNIGLLCGAASGITVIDIDDINFLSTLTRDMDTSVWVMSARDNETNRGHIFFKYVPELAAQKHHLIGLEVLSDGNNAVLPPSVHYSGGVYRWNPGGPGPDQVPVMPEQFKARLLELFKTEKKLKELLRQSRPCFRKFFETPEKLHGGDGRRFMLAAAAELKAAAQSANYGSQEALKCFRMAAKLVYREDYDRARTDKELSNVDPERTWKCQTLKENFSDICDCSQCKFKQGEAAPGPGRQPRQAGAQAALNFDMLEVAQALQARVPIFYDQAGAYWIWSADGYTMTDETGLLITCKNVLHIPGLTVQKTKAEFLEGVRITGRERQVLPRDPAWIQFKDRVINFRTGETFSPTPEYFFTTPLPYNLGDSEETPLIDKLFEEWVGPDRKKLLYEILAYSLIDDYPIHRLFCLIGSGRNGKGQFMKLLRRFIGLNNVTSTELERIEESRFETAKLFQKKACFIGETSFNTLTKTNRLKQLTGGDVVTGEWKHKKPFDFLNTAKIIMATNSLPETRDRTDGFYSRWLIVDFPNRFREGADLIDPIPDKEFENLGRKSLRILKELLEAGGFYREGSIEERARVYEEKSNPVAAFIKSQCEQDPEAWTPLYELFDSFEAFQTQHGYRIITRKQFGIQLLEMGYEREKSTGGNFNGYYIQGLKLKRNGGSGIQLSFKTDPEAPQEAQEKPQDSPGQGTVIFTPIPGATIPQEDPDEDITQDKEIIEAARVYTAGTFYIKNIERFVEFYIKKHPYIKDKVKTGGRIRLVQRNGWRPIRKKQEKEEAET